jgi:hypothetical protein
VVLRELSIDLEKGQAAERTTQLKVMEVEADKLRVGAGIMKRVRDPDGSAEGLPQRHRG